MVLTKAQQDVLAGKSISGGVYDEEKSHRLIAGAAQEIIHKAGDLMDEAEAITEAMRGDKSMSRDVMNVAKEIVRLAKKIQQESILHYQHIETRM